MNGEFVHWSTYCSLTAKELNDEEVLQRDFDKKIEDKLGTKATVKDFYDTNIEETPTFEMYGDNDGVEGTPDEPPEELEPTPDLSTDVYFNTSIVLPRRENMSREKVVYRKQDIDGNPIGH